MRTLSGADLEWLWAEMGHAVRVAQPLPEALREAAKANPGTRRGRAAQRIADAIASGRPLPEAVAEDRAFPFGAAAALESGVRGGRLQTVFESLAINARDDTSFRLGIFHAVAYPLVIALVGLAAALFIQIRVLPMFNQMFIELDVSLPSLTLIVLEGFTVGAFVALAAPAAALLALYLVPARIVPFPRGALDRIRLRIPLVGTVLKRFLLARWCGAMGVLLSAGVPEPQAVRIAGRSTGHAGFERRSRRLAAEIEKGRPLGDAMSDGTFFPAPLVWMVTSSQKIGGHAGIWNAAQQLYRVQGEQLSHVVSVILRVVFIVLALLMVGITVLSMFLPMIKLMNSLGG